MQLLRYCQSGLSSTFSDYRSNIAPSDSDRDCPSGRDSDQFGYTGMGSMHQSMQHQAKLGISTTGADSESGGSHSPSPRASRRRTKIRSHTLTSLCLLSHHPFFTKFRECLFLLKKLIDACNEASSPKNVGASARQSERYVLAGFCISTKLHNQFSTKTDRVYNAEYLLAEIMCGRHSPVKRTTTHRLSLCTT